MYLAVPLEGLAVVGLRHRSLGRSATAPTPEAVWQSSAVALERTHDAHPCGSRLLASCRQCCESWPVEAAGLHRRQRHQPSQEWCPEKKPRLEGRQRQESPPCLGELATS